MENHTKMDDLGVPLSLETPNSESPQKKNNVECSLRMQSSPPKSLGLLLGSAIPRLNNNNREAIVIGDVPQTTRIGKRTHTKQANKTTYNQPTAYNPSKKLWQLRDKYKSDQPPVNIKWIQTQMTMSMTIFHIISYCK